MLQSALVRVSVMQNSLPGQKCDVTQYLSEEKSEDVVEVGIDHQGEEDDHTYNLYAFHELVARLATGNHLEQEEHEVTTIECGDREDVHESKHDGDESGH